MRNFIFQKRVYAFSKRGMQFAKHFEVKRELSQIIFLVAVFLVLMIFQMMSGGTASASRVTKAPSVLLQGPIKLGPSSNPLIVEPISRE